MIKGYTDIGQSRKLAEILPHDSADMYWEDEMSVEFGHGWHPQHFPCWSLSALMNVIPQPLLEAYGGCWRCESFIKEKNLRVFGKSVNTPVEACINMILKLKARNLI